MKYIEILEDIEFYSYLKGHEYKIGSLHANSSEIVGLISASRAGALIHAGKAKFIDAPPVPEVKEKPKKKAVKAKKKDTQVNSESDSDITEESN